jgi:acyl carrier protein
VAGLGEAERRRVVLDVVRRHVGEVLGYGPGRPVAVDTPFKNLGFDSLMAVELRNQLNRATGLRLPASLVFDHPTVQELAAYVETALAAADGPAVDPILDDLVRIEKALTGAELGDDARERIADRLTALLALSAPGRETADPFTQPEPADGPDFVDELEAATADQILDVIEKEFGNS